VSVHIEIPLSDVDLIDNIGDGTEASVFKAHWEDKLVAVKRFRGIPARDQFIRELSIMSLCRHPNLVRCYGGQTTKEAECTIVTELMDDNLFDVLANNSLSFPFAKILYIALNVARGMEFLHSCNLIHRDLKSNNLLVRNIASTFAEVKICDFGLSRVVDKSKLMTGNVGTVSWIPPEIFEKKQYNEKCDVYSFAIILWELYYRKVPFSDISPFEIPMHVIEGKRPPLTKDVPKHYSKLMKACWLGKSSRRPSFTQIIKGLNKLQQISSDNSPGHRRPSPLPRSNSRDRSYSTGSVGRMTGEKMLSSESAPGGGGSPSKTQPKLSMRMGLMNKSSKKRERAKDNGTLNGNGNDDAKSG